MFRQGILQFGAVRCRGRGQGHRGFPPRSMRARGSSREIPLSRRDGRDARRFFGCIASVLCRESRAAAHALSAHSRLVRPRLQAARLARHGACFRGLTSPPDLNRADAVVRRLLLWCFRNRETGAITIAQTPNLALSVFLVASAILWLPHPTGAISTVAKVVATGSLIVWALDEVVRGVNPWRRVLGVAVLIYVVSTVRL